MEEQHEREASGAVAHVGLAGGVAGWEVHDEGACAIVGRDDGGVGAGVGAITGRKRGTEQSGAAAEGQQEHTQHRKQLIDTRGQHAD